MVYVTATTGRPTAPFFLSSSYQTHPVSGVPSRKNQRQDILDLLHMRRSCSKKANLVPNPPVFCWSTDYLPLDQLWQQRRMQWFRIDCDAENYTWRDVAVSFLPFEVPTTPQPRTRLTSLRSQQKMTGTLPSTRWHFVNYINEGGAFG